MKVTTLFAICFLVCLTLSVLVFNYYDTEFNKRDSPRVQLPDELKILVEPHLAKYQPKELLEYKEVTNGIN